MCRLFANTMLVYIEEVSLLEFGNSSLTYAEEWLHQEIR